MSTPPSGMHVWRGLTAAKARPSALGCCEVTCKRRDKACWPRLRLHLRRVQSTFGISTRLLFVWKRAAQTSVMGEHRVLEGAICCSCERLTVSLPRGTLRLLMPPTTLAVSLPAAPGPRYPFNVRAFRPLKACLPSSKYAFHVSETPELSALCTSIFSVQYVSKGRAAIRQK